jgi:hypothetical protein
VRLGTGRESALWSSTNRGVTAWLGARTGIWWLKDGLPAKPATVGAAAIPPAATTPPQIINKRFTDRLLTFVSWRHLYRATPVQAAIRQWHYHHRRAWTPRRVVLRS